MPANLTPQYKEAEARYRAAVTVEEKRECLTEMLRIIPKHKGTEKLQADLKKRLSKLGRAESQKSAARAPGEFVDREGVKQTLLLGPPNAGKSALLAALTAATPEVAEYPYTTTHLLPGMMPVRDVQLQLVDSPAISHDFVRPFMNSQLRATDLVLLVVSLADDDLLSGVDALREILEGWHVRLVPAEPGTGPSREREARVPALVVGTHADDDAAALREGLLRDSLGERWPVHSVSTATGHGLDALREKILETLALVRVYTKVPGHKPDMTSPFLLERGATVMDLAAAVHKDVAAGLSFARIWGHDAFDGQHVQRDHILCDGDVVELHT